MTREEALSKYANKIKTKDELVLYCNIVNDIYDDVESKINELKESQILTMHLAEAVTDELSSERKIKEYFIAQLRDK